MRTPRYTSKELIAIAGLEGDDWGNWRRTYPDLRHREDITDGRGKEDKYTGATVYVAWVMKRLQSVGVKASEAASWAIRLRSLSDKMLAAKRRCARSGHALLFLNPESGKAKLVEVNSLTSFDAWPTGFRGKSCIFVMDLAGLPDLEP